MIPQRNAPGSPSYGCCGHGTPELAKVLLDLGYNHQANSARNRGDHNRTRADSHGLFTGKYWGLPVSIDAMQEQ